MTEWFGPSDDLRRVVYSVPGLRVVEYRRPKWAPWAGFVWHGDFVGTDGRWMVALLTGAK